MAKATIDFYSYHMSCFKSLIISFFILGSVVSATAKAHDVVVGGYVFPPFVEEDFKSGLTLEVLEKLNRTQSKFKFIFKPTSAKRRYTDFSHGRFDLMVFEDPAWGWASEVKSFVASREVLKADEVYVAMAEKAQSQAFFQDLKGKRIRGILGYHYNLAKMSLDPFALKAAGLVVSESNEDNMKALQAGKADVTIVNNLWLQRYLRSKPNLQSRILVGEKPDQSYSLRAILNPKSSLAMAELQAMLDKLAIAKK